MPDKLSTAQKAFGDVAPKLAEITDDILFGDVWERPGLSPRDRSLILFLREQSTERSRDFEYFVDLGW